ncbi:MAG: hypothetical protein JWO87_3237 [Phycisphaerales bacterium]|jgi:hypothetical protein|nr:hypothetical protein [Phycisphaerales bacterium]
MAEEQPSLHIDTDWKKQAQEEKRRLAEQQEQQRTAAAQSPAAQPAGNGVAPPARAGGRPGRESRPASFETLVQSLLTQALLYLGELAPQGSEPMLNLDMAKHQVDMLGILEDKTKNNLTPEEQHMLDTALYELRTRFINVASQFIG